MPFSVCYFIPFNLRIAPPPIGESFGLFLGPAQIPEKQSTLQNIEGGMGGKPTGFMFCLLWGFFLQSPIILSLAVHTSLNFVGF